MSMDPKQCRDRFQHAYDHGDAPWDNGAPCAELLRTLTEGRLIGKTALEVGCGTGANAVALAQAGFAVTACDFIETAVRIAEALARRAGVSVDFRVADVLTDPDFGPPFDVIFDRGVYHHVRRVDLQAFLRMIVKHSRPGTRWLSLAGNADEKVTKGPPRVSESEIRAELGGLFEIERLRTFRFDDGTDDRPLAWAILMRRRS